VGGRADRRVQPAAALLVVKPTLAPGRPLAAAAVQECGVHQPEQGAIERIHGDRWVQVQALPGRVAGVVQAGRVLDGQHVPLFDPHQRGGARGLHHFGGRHLRVAQEASQPDFARPVDAERLDLAEVGREIDDPAAGRQVAVDLAVAVAQVDVDGPALEPPQLLRGRARQLQVRDVDIGADGGVIDVVQEPAHRIDVIDQRQLERLQLQRDLQPQVGGVLAQLADVAHAGLPLLGRRNHLPLPDVLAQHQQHVLGIIFVGQIKVLAAALEVEALHAGVEVDQPDGDAGNADDGQPGPITLALDETAFLDGEVEGVGEDIDRIEAVVNWLETEYPSPAFPIPGSDGKARVGSTQYFAAYGAVERSYPLLRAGQPGPGETDPPEVLELMHRVTLIPMVRRTFGEDGKLTDALERYANAMKEVAAEKKAALIYLHASSKKTVDPLGLAASAAVDDGSQDDGFQFAHFQLAPVAD